MITNAIYGYEFRGLSTDDKSDVSLQVEGGKIPNGAVFFEIDTGKVFMYNGDSGSWVEI